MNFLELVKSRQSDRKFDKTRTVEKEKLVRILEAARLAPSACNAQPWKFVVVTDPDKTAAIGKACASFFMNGFAKDAPVHVLVVEESANITSMLGDIEARAMAANVSIIRFTQSICVTVSGRAEPKNAPRRTLSNATTLMVSWNTMKRCMFL